MISSSPSSFTCWYQQLPIACRQKKKKLQPSQEMRLTQECFNSAGSPLQPATVLYMLSNEGQLLLVGTLVLTLYVLFLLRWRVELWKKRRTWSRIPPESLQQAIKYTLVTVETGWYVGEAINILHICSLLTCLLVSFPDFLNNYPHEIKTHCTEMYFSCSDSHKTIKNFLGILK